MSHNEIKDISVLGGMTGLLQCTMGNNLVEDISPLKTCTSLYYLTAEHNKISDWTSLDELSAYITGKDDQDIEKEDEAE